MPMPVIRRALITAIITTLVLAVGEIAIGGGLSVLQLVAWAGNWIAACTLGAWYGSKYHE